MVADQLEVDRGTEAVRAVTATAMVVATITRDRGALIYTRFTVLQ